MADLLRTQEAGIAAPNLTETIDILVRVNRIESKEVEAKLVPLLVEDLVVASMDENAARWAARVRIDHYHSRDMPLSLGDCLMLGAAIASGGAIATSDRPVAEAARLEGVEVVSLPDSRGERP